jgi:hypothetical protein
MKPVLIAALIALTAAAVIVLGLPNSPLRDADRADPFGRERVSVDAVSALPSFAGAADEVARVGNQIGQWETKIAIAAPYKVRTR